MAGTLSTQGRSSELKQVYVALRCSSVLITSDVMMKFRSGRSVLLLESRKKGKMKAAI